MEAVAVLLPPDTWNVLPAEAQTLMLALQAQVVALRAELATLQVQRQELHAQLSQDSSNSSRPPSSDPPQAVAKRIRHVPPCGRNRGA